MNITVEEFRKLVRWHKDQPDDWPVILESGGYRAGAEAPKPEPPKPREFWLMGADIFNYDPTCEPLQSPAAWSVGPRVIHVREVLE